MSKKPTSKISTLGSQITSVISVSLVLIIVGVLAVLGIVARSVSGTMLSDVSVVVKLDMLAPDAQIAAVGESLRGAEYAAAVQYTSAQEVLEQEMEYNAEVLDLLGENPYSAEYEVTLLPAYVQADSIQMITNRIMLLGGVDEVVSQIDMVRSIDNVTHRVTLVLSAVAIILLVISIVLIFNTVSIGVYGRRFIIRTMQLVGATSAFIRRPFVLAGLWSGFVAGCIASLALLGLEAYLSRLDLQLSLSIPWTQMAIVCAGLIGLGLLICTLSAIVATNRYLRASTDLLYS